MKSHFFIGNNKSMNQIVNNKKVVILGEHPILPNIWQQYSSLGYEVCHYNNIDEPININSFDELFILTNNLCASIDADNKAISILNRFALQYDIESHNGNKLLCHLLLQSSTSLRILQMTNLREDIKQVIDVYPFTMEELWSQCIEVDYEPITIQCNKYAHIVIFGMGNMAEMVAINIAHKAHFPNFTRNKSLRTRITIIEENISSKYEEFILKYPHLFDNSYYRVITPSSHPIVQTFHTPMYEKTRECFVDVEWEFVDASIYNTTVRQKLAYWAADNSQLLTIVMAHSNENYNIDSALNMPEEVFLNHTPIYTYLRNATLLESTTQIEKFASIQPFGMLNDGYDVRLPLITMAKTINHIYDQFYNDNHQHFDNSEWQLQYAVDIDIDAMEKSWAKLSNVKRQSSIYNAMSIASKMKSIGLEPNDWAKFYDISQQEIELLAQVEHNRWNVEELILGYRPCTDEEQAIVENDIAMKEEMKRTKKVHYDIRAYNDLRTDATGKSATIYDICLCSCLPLIAKSFADKYITTQSKGGNQ